jgi:hypothetical protein
MATNSVTEPRKRRRLRNIISRRAEEAPTWSSTSAGPPGPTDSVQESSALSGTQSTSGSASVPAAVASSHTGITTSPAQGPSATSTLCGEILEKALKQLRERDRVIIQDYISANDIASTLKQAFEAAQAKRKVCESKRWIFTVGRHTVKLQDEADKVILWLNRFKLIRDIAVNADPIHAGLPWAGIRLLLEVCILVLTSSYIMKYAVIPTTV